MLVVAWLFVFGFALWSINMAWHWRCEAEKYSAAYTVAWERSCYWYKQWRKSEEALQRWQDEADAGALNHWTTLN